MVLFENVMLNQHVEVLIDRSVHKGIVRFKGVINGKPGDWVGVEMDEPVGRGNGMINGRRYFSAMEDYAVFTTASHIRFIPQNRFMFNRYKPVRVNRPFIDEDLFSHSSYSPYNCYDTDDRRRSVSWIDESFMDRHTDSYNDRGSRYDELFPVRKVYPRRQSISSLIPPASARWSDARGGSPPNTHRWVTGTARPISARYSREEFITSPSIPQSYLPHSCLKCNKCEGWRH